MAVTTASLFDQQADRITEVLNKNIGHFLPALDPVWRDTLVTSQGVGNPADMGRNLEIIKIYTSGFEGTLEQSNPRGEFPLYGDVFTDVGGSGVKAMIPAQLLNSDLLQTFPDPLDAPQNKPFRINIQMRAMVGNLRMYLSEMSAEATPAFIGQIIGPRMRNFARNIAHTVSNYCYINQNNGYALSTLTNVSISGSGSNFEISFEPGNLAIDRFYDGQRLDIYTESSGVPTIRRNDTVNAVATQLLTTRQQLIVKSVDEVTNTVTLWTNVNPETTSSSHFNGGTPGAGDFVIYAQSAVQASGAVANPTAMAGINSWMKFGGTGTNQTRLLGSDSHATDFIDVEQHPQFRSFLADHGSQLMTEHSLRKYCQGFNRAKMKYGMTIDCLIASDGVWLGMQSTKIGREIIDRTGRLASLEHEGSVGDEYGDAMVFNFGGRILKGYTSNYVESGVIYGIKKGGGNWKRYIPPSPAGVQRASGETFAPYEFIGQAAGMPSNRYPVYETVDNRNRVTEVIQMPGWMKMQFVPDQAAGLKIINVGEDREYSTSGSGL